MHGSKWPINSARIVQEFATGNRHRTGMPELASLQPPSIVPNTGHFFGRKAFGEHRPHSKNDAKKFIARANKLAKQKQKQELVEKAAAAVRVAERKKTAQAEEASRRQRRERRLANAAAKKAEEKAAKRRQREAVKLGRLQAAEEEERLRLAQEADAEEVDFPYALYRALSAWMQHIKNMVH